MKKIKVFGLLLMAIMMASITVACSSNAKPTIDLKSESSATISVVEEYSLDFTTSNAETVTVTADGGVYDEANKKFSSSEAGDFKLTIKAGNGKNTVEKVVSIKVVAIDFTVLNTAIASADKLKASDYKSFTNVTTKLNLAKGALINPISQENVIKQANDLNEAISKLEAKTIVKATVSVDKVVCGSKEYNLSYYKEHDAIAAEILLLDADAAVKLNSKYLARLDEIMVKHGKLNIAVSGAGENLVSKAKMATISAQTQFTDKEVEGTYSWKVDNSEVSTKNSYTFTPVLNTTYTITVTATVKDRGTVSETVIVCQKLVPLAKGVEFDSANSANGNTTVNVDNGSVVISGKDTPWGDGEFRKKAFIDKVFTGNFALELDIQNQPSTSLPSIQLCDSNGSPLEIHGLVNTYDSKIEVRCNGDTNIGAGTTIKTDKIRVIMTREIRDGKSYYTFATIDSEGNELAKIESAAHDNTDGIIIAFSTAIDTGLFGGVQSSSTFSNFSIR